MGQTIIYPQGTAEITVPAAQSIAVSNFGGGIAKIYYLIETASFPDAWQFQQTLEDSSVTLGAFSVQTKVKIEAGNSRVVYDVAASPDTGIGDADTLNGMESDTSDTADTIAARDASGNLTANVLISDVAGGTAPLTVTSTTVVPNLNADQTDGYDASETSTVSTLAARDASANLTANVLISDVAIGTAPLNVTSTTVVPNLNVDQTDGYDVAEAATVSTIAARDASGDLRVNVLISDVAIGTAPLTVTSTTVVSNFNADTVDSLHAGSFLRSDDSDEATGIITLSSNSSYPLQITGTDNGKILLSGATNPYIEFQENTTDKGFIKWSPNGFLQVGNDEDGSRIRIKDDLDFSDDNGVTWYSIYHENNFGKTQIDALGINATSVTGAVYRAQGAQTAKTTSTTLTAAEINTGIITVNNGAAGTTTLTLPLATAMDSQFTGVAAGYSWDFSVVNISTTAAEDADVGTNTGWTLVGNMDIEADDDPRARSSAKFRARKTGAGAWTLYRMA